MRRFQLGHRRFGLLDLLAHHVPLVTRRFGQHLPSHDHVGAGPAQLVPGPHDLAQLLVASGEIAYAVRISQDGRVSQVGLEGVEFRLERGHPVVESWEQAKERRGSRRGMRPRRRGGVA